MEDQWKRKLFQITRDSERLGTTTGPREAAHVSRAALEVSGSYADVVKKLENLEVGDEIEVGEGVRCKRVQDAEAPGLVDPVQAARNRKPRPEEN